MSLKSKLKEWITCAASAGVKLMQVPREHGKSQQPRKKPKTQADYEALHAAELKRRRKAETRLRNQHKQEA